MTSLFNPKEKEYYCEKEKKFFRIKSVNPSCPDCGQTLVVALRSILDSSRITGSDELAPRDYRAALRIRKS